MEILIQPEKSKTCGQHCFAMIEGISVAEAIEIFGVSTKTGTSIKHMHEALKKVGYVNPAKRLKKYVYQKELPETCLFIIKWNTKGSHWVVYHKGKIYCPGNGIIDYSMQNIANMKGNVVGYLDIGKKVITPDLPTDKNKSNVKLHDFKTPFKSI